MVHNVVKILAFDNWVNPSEALSCIHEDSKYILLFDSSYKLAKGYEKIIDATIENSNSDAFYFDAKIGNDYFFKPDYLESLLLSLNFIGHTLLIKTELLVRALKELSPQNITLYQILLYLTLLGEKKINIERVQKVLCEKNDNKKSVNSHDVFFKGYKEDNIFLQNLIQSRDLKINFKPSTQQPVREVHYKIDGQPLISIIIPFKDQHEVLNNCIKSIYSLTTYKNFEIICVNNNSSEEKTYEYINTLESSYKNLIVIDYKEKFNFSKINNFAIRYSKGKHIVFLNNDTAIITLNWLENMLEYSQKPEVGVVGCKLLYHDGTIQHAGIFNFKNEYCHIFRNLSSQGNGYFFMLQTPQKVDALTFACVMIEKNKLDKIGLLDENLPIEFNDIEFCIRAEKRGYTNIYTPLSVLYHYESKTRHNNKSLYKKFSTLRDLAYLLQKYNGFVKSGLHKRLQEMNDTLIRNRAFYCRLYNFFKLMISKI